MELKKSTFTKEFKYTLSGVIALGIVGALSANQYVQQKQINALQSRPVVEETVMVTPTASPTATLKPVATQSSVLKVTPKTAVTGVPVK